MPMPSEDEMRAEFHALRAERDKIQAQAKPHRDAYDKKRAELMERELRELKPLEAKMKGAEEGLYEINQKIAMLSRALGGRTGEPASQ